MKPYVPIFSSTPARITEPAVGASTCASGSQVCSGTIGTLIAKRSAKAASRTACTSSGRCVRTRSANANEVMPVVLLQRPDEVDHRGQHQDAAERRVEDELDRRVDAPLAAPDADDQEHRDQHRLPEHVEEERGPARGRCRASRTGSRTPSRRRASRPSGSPRTRRRRRAVRGTRSAARAAR